MDSDNVPFKLDINLQKMSIVALTIRFWELPVIQEKVRDCIRVHRLNANNFNKIAEDVILQMQSAYEIPHKILVEIRETVLMINEKIFDWFVHVNFDLLLDHRYAEKICWTCYGTVDEEKIFQLYWINDLQLFRYKRVFSGQTKNKVFYWYINSVYSMACRLCQEEFVSSNLDTMNKLVNELCWPSLSIGKSVNSHILISVWLCYYLAKDKQRGYELYKSINWKTKRDSDVELLLRCATGGYLNAVKYFARNLSGNDTDILIWAAENALYKFRQSQSSIKKKDAFVEILMFLINRMSQAGRIKFLKKHLYSLFIVIQDVWPYQEVFLQMFDYVLPFMDEKEYKVCLYVVKFHLSFRTTPIDTNICQQMLQKVLEVTSIDVKKDMIATSADFFRSLTKMNDFSTLKIILNDPGMRTCRKEIIDVSTDIGYYRSTIRNRNFEPANEFMEEFLKGEEKKAFKNNFHQLLQEFVQDNNFVLAEELLDWLAGSIEEKKQLKIRINAAGVCWALYMRKNFRLETFNTLLNWQYDGDEEQMQLAKIALLRNDSFISVICREFFRIWSGYCMSSAELAKNKCLIFLSGFLEGEEVDTFKQEKIIKDEMSIEVFCNFLLLPKNFETINELLKFCSLSSEKITEIKQKIRIKIMNWINLFSFNRNNFRMADAIVNWIAEDEKEKRDIISNFMNSGFGSKLCVKILNLPSPYFNLDSVLIFFNLWVKPYGDVTRLINDTSSTRVNVRLLLAEMAERDFLMIDTVQRYFF